MLGNPPLNIPTEKSPYCSILYKKWLIINIMKIIKIKSDLSLAHIKAEFSKAI